MSGLRTPLSPPADKPKKVRITLNSSQIDRIVNQASRALFTAAEVLKAIRAIAKRIVDSIETGELKDNLVIVPLLNGGVWFAERLKEAILQERNHTPIRTKYIQTSKFEDEHTKKETVEVNLLQLNDSNLPSMAKAATFLVVDDVLDGGDSLKAARIALQAKGLTEKDMKTVVMLDKPTGRNPSGLQKADYTGLTLHPDPQTGKTAWVFGCGMDLTQGQVRDHSAILCIEDFNAYGAVIKEAEEEALSLDC